MKNILIKILNGLYIILTGLCYITVIILKEKYSLVLIRETFYTLLLLTFVSAVTIKYMENHKINKKISIPTILVSVSLFGYIIGGISHVDTKYVEIASPLNKYELLLEDTREGFEISKSKIYMKKLYIFKEYVGTIRVEKWGDIIKSERTKLKWIDEDILAVEFQHNNGKLYKFKLDFNKNKFIEYTN
ncbi:MAG: hypothetical protein K0S30_1741 [Clostridia bacterium]|jgi:hypothetical protein|nr:hypothetical protein [Clostridia bacterium]